MSTDLTEYLRLQVQVARNDVFVWGVSTWTGYRYGGPADTAGSGVEWLDIFGSSRDVSIERGLKRDGVDLALEAGVMQATVLNSNVDPNTNPYIKPGTPIRLVTADEVPVFTGTLDNIKVTYKDKKPQVYLTATDLVKTIANISRSGVVGGTYDERVQDLLWKHGIPFEVSGASGLVLAQNAYDSTLLNHLNLATTSERGHVFVDKANVVQARGKDYVNSARGFVAGDQSPPVGEALTNLIRNPSFEDGMAQWDTFDEETTTDSANVRSGSASAVLSTADGLPMDFSDYILPTFDGSVFMPVTPGQTYTFGAWCMVKEGILDSVELSANPNDENGDGVDITIIATEEEPAVGQWMLLWGTYTVPDQVDTDWDGIPDATTALVLWSLDVYPPDGNEVPWTVYVDDCILLQGEHDLDAIGYFDGNTAGAYWNEDGTSTFDPSRFVSYTDISVGYDSTALVNDVYINNLTMGYNEEMEPLSVSTKWGPYRNVTSIATFGAATEEIDTNLSSELDIEEFAQAVLASNDTPELRVDSLRLNMTDRPEMAADLEVFDLVNVEYSADAFHIGEDFSVLRIKHTITASNDYHRWMVDVDLISNKEDNND